MTSLNWQTWSLKSLTVTDRNAQREEGNVEVTMDASPCDEAEQGFFCPICYEKRPLYEKVVLSTCHHQFCHGCLLRHFTLEITESRVDLHCPTCSARVPPHEVQACTTAEIFNKYLDFTLRKCLVGMKHVRFCPAPDCPYAEISLDLYGCPPNLFQCRRPGCMRRSCYRCKGDYHNTPCRGESMGRPLHSALTGVGTAMVGVVRDNPPTAGTTELGCKRCPHCDSLVEKIEDGSCNHMTCVCCGRDFCWLCLHPAGGMHFLSPTGCTLWGERQWSTRRKWIVRSILWAVAPLGIFLISLILFPTLTIAIPVLVGMEIYHRNFKTKWRKLLACILGVTGSSLASPFLGLLGSFLIVPLGLTYVYGIIPLHILWTSSFGRKMRVRLRNAFRRRTTPTQDDSNA